MHALIEENLLSPALDALKKTLGDPSMPASTCIHIDANDQTGRLLMHSTDGLYHTITRVPAKNISQAGEALVDGKTLTGLVHTFNKKEIELSQDTNHTVLVGSGKKKAARVPGIAADLAIGEPMLTNEVKVNLTKDELQHLYSSVEFARLNKAAGSQDYKLQGIGVKVMNNEMVFITTDKSRVAVAKAVKQVGNLDLVIPFKAFADVLSWATNDVVMTIADNLVKFESGDFTYYTPIIQGTFPAYQRYVTRPKVLAQVNRNDLINALQRADIITQRDDETPGMIHMALVPNDGLVISGEVSTGGMIDETVPCHNPFKEERKVSLIGRYVLDAIKRIKTEQVEIFIDKSPDRPVLVFPEGSDDIGHMILVMLVE